jgi:hypothetical protein
MKLASVVMLSLQFHTSTRAHVPPTHTYARVSVQGDRVDITNDVDADEEWSFLHSEGGVIDDTKIPLAELKVLGKATLKAIVSAVPASERPFPARFSHLPSARVDFGCCLDRNGKSKQTCSNCCVATQVRTECDEEVSQSINLLSQTHLCMPAIIHLSIHSSMYLHTHSPTRIHPPTHIHMASAHARPPTCTQIPTTLSLVDGLSTRLNLSPVNSLISPRGRSCDGTASTTS